MKKINHEETDNPTTIERMDIAGRIGVFGAGWLGAPLVAHLLKAGFAVNASVCSASGKQRLLHFLTDKTGLAKTDGKIGKNRAKNGNQAKNEFAQQADLNTQLRISVLTANQTKLDGNEESIKRFYSGNLQILVLCFPPGRAEGGGYEAYKEAVCHAVAPLLTEHEEIGHKGLATSSKANRIHLPWVVFVSSTSVYGKQASRQKKEGEFFDEKENIPLFTEKDTPFPVTRGGQAVWGAEQALRKLLGRRLVCLRCAGLVGKDRHPARFYRKAEAAKTKGKTSAIAEHPVNLVVQEDVVAVLGGLVARLMRQEFVPPNEVYNIAAKSHPRRSQFYRVVDSDQAFWQEAGKSLQPKDGNRKAEVTGGRASGHSSGRKSRERSSLPKCIDSTLARKELGFQPLYDDLLLWARGQSL